MGEIEPADRDDTMPLTVVVITYNHERFIRQSLDSVFAQRTSFPFEIIITEDRSTDRTREIVLEYQSRYPDRIRVALSEQNLHNNEVGARAIRAARGKYIALLDGDDYWVSTDKLQKQFDYMESHPDAAVTYHQALRITEEGEVFESVDGLDYRGTIDDAIQDCFLPACSSMYRRAIIRDPPDWIRDLPAGDWPTAIVAAESGFIDKVEGLVAHYRWHENGAWTGLTQMQRALNKLIVLDATERNLDSDHREAFRRSRARAVGMLRQAIKEESTDYISNLLATVGDQRTQIEGLWRRLDRDKARLRRRWKIVAAIGVAAVVATAVVTWIVARLA